MQTGVLRVLRATAASWWRHKELRRTGQTGQAQRLERETVLRDLGYLRQAAALPHAHAICGEGGTFLHLGWTTVSTFAPIERFPLAALAVACGTPFIDIRPVTDVIAFANLPRVARDGSVDPEPWGPGRSVSLSMNVQPQPDRPDPTVIAVQNDAFRKLACLGVPPAQPIQGRMHVTRALVEAGDGFMAEAVKATGEFATFEPENDPEGWHDFGAVEIRGETVFWKIDLYEADSDFRYGAETPDNPATTMRVLTIMLARDW